MPDDEDVELEMATAKAALAEARKLAREGARRYSTAPETEQTPPEEQPSQDPSTRVPGETVLVANVV